MKSRLNCAATAEFGLVIVPCQNILAAASLPADRYHEVQRYEGTFSQGTNAPEQAVVLLKYDRPVWPLLLFDDEESVSATIRIAEKPPFDVTLFKRLKDADIHLRDNEKNPVVGSFSDFGMRLRLPYGNFEGRYMIPGHDGWGKGGRGLTSRQIYHFIYLPMAGLALGGALAGAILGHRRNQKIAGSMLKGVFIAIVVAPIFFVGFLLALMLVVALMAQLFAGG